MSEQEVFEGLDPACPPTVKADQRILVVDYYSFDGKLHQGQLVIHKDLVADCEAVFALARQERFPIYSVIPISHPKFRKNGRWDDDLSMEANNTSGFNYRLITGGTSLSKHALGFALDINPVQNPYIKGDLILPPGSQYKLTEKGTLAADGTVVRAFQARAWNWGGTWSSPIDYQHFEKPLL